jgi:exodeoxyribonuclease V alpha subunit
MKKGLSCQAAGFRLDTSVGTIHIFYIVIASTLFLTKGRFNYVKRQETSQGENQQAQAEEKKKAEPSQKKDVAGVTSAHFKYKGWAFSPFFILWIGYSMPAIQGIIKDITFRNEENGFTVLRLATEGAAHPTLCVGVLPGVEPGETIKADGDYAVHPKFGAQFSVASYEIVKPVTLEGIASLLGSGLISNIGSVRAKSIIDVFGLQTLDILDNEPRRLREVRGIGEKMLAGIVEAWKRRRHILDLMMFLSECAITVNMASKIYKAYGESAKEKISQNPYCLIDDIYGVGFLKADAIAQKLGFTHDSFKRIRAGLSHVVAEAASDGHTYLPQNELVSSAAQLLDVKEEMALFSLDHIVRENVLVRDGDRIYLPVLFDAETFVANRFSQRARTGNPVVGRYGRAFVDSWIDKYAKRSGWNGDPRQVEAVHGALSHGVFVLTGGPGTGKTTTLQVIVSFLREHSILVALAAPTGRAAQRMGSIAGLKASTLHRLLEFRPGSNGYRFARNAENPLDADMVIVDEVSMIDLVLMKNFLAAIRPSTALLFVGDSNQLPSIGPGSVLADMIGSGIVPHVELSTVFRQASESRIVTAAHEIMHGAVPVLQNEKQGNLFFVKEEDPQRCVDTVVELVTRRLPSAYGLNPSSDIQVLSPIHKGIVGTQNLNLALKQALNPGDDGVRRGEICFSSGDKVMQIRNDYDRGVFNGDIGYVKSTADGTTLLVDFDGETVAYEQKDIDELVHAYCISIHKSQGCEFKAVVIVAMTQHYIMLQRNLLYTALTRARRLGVIVGSRQALRIAVQNNETFHRYSRLRERIISAAGQ